MQASLRFCSFEASAMEPKTALPLQALAINSYQLMRELLQCEHCFIYFSDTEETDCKQAITAGGFWVLDTNRSGQAAKKMPAIEVNSTWWE